MNNLIDLEQVDKKKKNKLLLKFNKMKYFEIFRNNWYLSWCRSEKHTLFHIFTNTSQGGLVFSPHWFKDSQWSNFKLEEKWSTNCLGDKSHFILVGTCHFGVKRGPKNLSVCSKHRVTLKRVLLFDKSLHKGLLLCCRNSKLIFKFWMLRFWHLSHSNPMKTVRGTLA